MSVLGDGHCARCGGEAPSRTVVCDACQAIADGFNADIRLRQCAQARDALKRIGNIIRDAPFSGEQRDGAYAAYIENARIILDAFYETTR